MFLIVLLKFLKKVTQNVLLLKKKMLKTPPSWGFLLWLSGLRTQHSAHEDVGSIPGLTHWIKDSALLQAAV